LEIIFLNLQLGRFREALEDIQISLQLCPRPFKALRTCARIYEAMKNYNAAANSWEEALDASLNDDDWSSASKGLKAAQALLSTSKGDSRGYYQILG
jgi:tetratricopeptide (TPR) repeat protein